MKMEQPVYQGDVDAFLAALWNAAPMKPSKAPEPEAPNPSPFKPRQRVRITSIDPNWNYACAGHPAVGVVGTVTSEASTPNGKTCVRFIGRKVPTTDGNAYTNVTRADPLRFYLPHDTLTLVVKE